MPRLVKLLLSVLFVGAAVPATASGAQTFGSALPSGAGPAVGCSGTTCATSLEWTAGSSPAVSPTDGVVVRWRLRTTEAQPGSVRLRVLRSEGGGWRFLRSSSFSAVPGTAGIHVFSTRVAISAGDYIGLDRPDTLDEIFRTAAGARSHVFTSPPPGDGASATPVTEADDELLINADVEPDVDRDGFGDESQDLCSIDPLTQGLCPRAPAPAPVAAAPSVDRSAPRVRLAFARTQDIDKLAVVARTSEAGRVGARGSVQTTRRRLRKAALLRLRGASRRMSRRGRVRLRLVLARRSRARVKRLLRRRGRAVARVTVTATDLSGNSRRVSRRIRLRP